jgi:hypothetical protein
MCSVRGVTMLGDLRTCQRKRASANGSESRAEAKRAAKLMRAAGVRTIRYFRCRYCGLWHLGTEQTGDNS